MPFAIGLDPEGVNLTLAKGLGGGPELTAKGLGGDPPKLPPAGFGAAKELGFDPPKLIPAGFGGAKRLGGDPPELTPAGFGAVGACLRLLPRTADSETVLPVRSFTTNLSSSTSTFCFVTIWSSLKGHCWPSSFLTHRSSRYTPGWSRENLKNCSLSCSESYLILQEVIIFPSSFRFLSL